jgi:hypothetical protein
MRTDADAIAMPSCMMPLTVHYSADPHSASKRIAGCLDRITFLTGCAIRHRNLRQSGMVCARVFLHFFESAAKMKGKNKLFASGCRAFREKAQDNRSERSRLGHASFNEQIQFREHYTCIPSRSM